MVQRYWCYAGFRLRVPSVLRARGGRDHCKSRDPPPHSSVSMMKFWAVDVEGSGVKAWSLWLMF